MNQTDLYPLKFAPIYKDKVWGGRTLEKLGRQLPGGSDELIGESWELADLSQTSVSGGGGGAERSKILNGPLADRTLHDVIQSHAKDIMGNLPLTEDGGFPLLVKFLDANTNLSVQVHPNQAYAATHADAFLKSECWYVLHAEKGAVIYKGVKEGVTESLFRKAIEENTVEELLITVPVKVGDMHYVPSGTCHALGAGILAAEVQTPSDTTFRVYDWGRTGRELHVDAAMECIKLGPPDVSQNELNTTVEGEHATITHLVTCDYFRVDRVQVKAGYECELQRNQPVVWMMLEGDGRFSMESEPDTKYATGQTLLLPAKMRPSLFTADTDTTYLEVTFPQADSNSIT
ncbi:type I phosphomannose isomerase catalytic subunit [Poriferisphaera sp. WC338]|uniref:type I phosphomannose isomerase catalytic subunit n=1 Tax=Poriferisphaera sp. WC338 TaxID=3425129 RepID=UPI003D81B5D8